MNSNHKTLFFFVSLCWLFYACGQKKPENDRPVSKTEVLSNSSATGNTIATRFSPPEDFARIAADSASFARYLRNLPLKPEGALVSYYNGALKPNKGIYAAVLDLPIGNRDLHQCADAVIHLRANYLFQNKRYDSIHYNFTNGFKADYANWRSGKRITINGNQVAWKQTSQASDSPNNFWKYLEMVFSYAGTVSLEKELQPVALKSMRVGDVFIKGGFPGHAVIVVDMAIDISTNEKVFLLAQSYMPAQELQILKNPNDGDLSPWYSLSEILNSLRTPEWTFNKADLRRF